MADEVEALRGQHLHIDGASGAAGDMMLGALLHLGLPRALFDRALDAIGLGGERLVADRVVKHGLAAVNATIAVDHRHDHGHVRHAVIVARMRGSGLEPDVLARALDIFRRLAEGVFDLDDLHARTEELAQFIAAAAGQYGFDPARVVALGYSNGANIASSVMLAHPGTLAGGMLFRPMVPFEPKFTPMLRNTRVLLSAGRQDPIVPQANTTRLSELLQQAGADVTLHWFDTGHGLVPREMETAARWFAEHFIDRRPRARED